MKRWLVVECALPVAMIAIVRWLGDHATAAWLQRGGRNGSAVDDGRRPTWDAAAGALA